MKKRVLPLAAGLAAGLVIAMPLQAAELSVKLELPQLQVAEYHKPYLAVWLEPAAGGPATQLAVWYDQKKKDNGGIKWLKDLRQWWRKGGRDLPMPLDGVTSATRAPGVHTLSWVVGKAPLETLSAGEYVLLVEASREGGGREVVKLPFAWPVKAARTVQDKGQEELGQVSLQLKP